MSGGCFTISLDFELLWGVRDHADRDSYGANVLGAREAVPRMLELFAENGVRVTWATVGFLMCEDRDELIACLPEAAARPAYANPAVSNYGYIGEVGADERQDPYYFAPSLVRQIADTPGQEVGTHTLSHYYCLEDGQTAASFEADLRAAVALATRRGIALRSIVFPRNQYAAEHLDICRRHGIAAYRGNPTAWAYRPAKGAEQTPLRRAMRLADAYSGMLGPKTFVPTAGEITNVAASSFLRPASGRLAPLHPLHLATTMRGMTAAARRGEGYHLWWHPHNFGRDMEANLAGLRRLVGHFRRLADSHGMVARHMGDLA